MSDPCLSLSQVKFPSWTSATSLRPSAPSLRCVSVSFYIINRFLSCVKQVEPRWFSVLPAWGFFWNCKVKFFFQRWIKRVSLFVQGSVRALLHEKIRDAYTHPQFITDVMKPMQIESIIDQDVRNTFYVKVTPFSSKGLFVNIKQVSSSRKTSSKAPQTLLV